MIYFRSAQKFIPLQFYFIFLVWGLLLQYGFVSFFEKECKVEGQGGGKNLEGLEGGEECDQKV